MNADETDATLSILSVFVATLVTDEYFYTTATIFDEPGTEFILNREDVVGQRRGLDESLQNPVWFLLRQHLPNLSYHLLGHSEQF